MTRNVWVLLKIQMLEWFSFNRMRHTKDLKARRRNKMFLGLYIFVSVVILSYVVGLSWVYINFGLAEQLLPLLLMVSSIIALVLSFFKANGTLFRFRDYDQLVSLPVKISELIFSRLLGLYVLNFLFSGAVLLTGGITYAVMMKPESHVCFFTLFALPFIPLIPITIASIVSVLIHAIASKFRRSSLMSTMLGLLLIVGILLLSFQFSTVSPDALKSLAYTLDMMIRKTYPPAALFADALQKQNILAFLLFVLISVVVFLLFIAILAPNFRRLNDALASQSTARNYKLTKLKTTGVFLALYKKELRCYFSSSVYVMNTLVGSIMLILGAIALAIYGIDTIVAGVEIPILKDMFIHAIPFFSCVIIGLACTTSSSLSLEGKNLWIIQSSPISTKHIFDSKIAVFVTISVPAIIISSVLFVISLRTDMLTSLFYFVTPLCYLFFIGYLGLYLNIKFPNFSWSNEVSVVKQSAPTGLTMLCDFMVGSIPILLLFVNKPESALLIMAFSSLAFLIFGALLRFFVHRTPLSTFSD